MRCPRRAGLLADSVAGVGLRSSPDASLEGLWAEVQEGPAGAGLPLALAIAASSVSPPRLPTCVPCLPRPSYLWPLPCCVPLPGLALQISSPDKRSYQQRLAKEQAAAKRGASRSGGLLGPSRPPPVDHYKMLGLERSSAAEEVGAGQCCCGVGGRVDSGGAE